MEADRGGLQVIVLGSGTSVGIPTIGCHCKVCTSDDPRDTRLRPSIALRIAGHTIVVDTTPDFRAQILRAKLDRLDAILYTHAHADHIMGLDDTRPFSFRQSGEIPIFSSEETFAEIRRAFAYIFSGDENESWVPKIRAHPFGPEDEIDVLGLKIMPIRVWHGKGTVYGYRIGSFAYLTDHSVIPDESLAKLEGLDTLFLDALRNKPHPTHSHVQRSLQYVEQLKPKRAFFTHISHDLPHARTEEFLPPHVRLAYDGLTLDIGDAL